MNDIECDMRQDMKPIIHVDMDIKVNRSKHSSILCLDDILSVESFKITEEYEDEEQEPHIHVELDLVQPSVISQPTE